MKFLINEAATLPDLCPNKSRDESDSNQSTS